jgi:hypothetical protein
MWRILIPAMVLILAGCSQHITRSDLDLLNGYWEIEKVSFPDGGQKEYSINTTIDYLEVTGNRGYRKKVNPNLDGSYETSDDAEYFTILEDAGIFKMRYENDLSMWTETIEAISKTNFSVMNESDITYHYKRFKGFKAKYWYSEKRITNPSAKPLRNS